MAIARLFLLMVCLGGLGAAQDDGFTWLTNYKEALAEAKRTGKPIFLEFRCEA